TPCPAAAWAAGWTSEVHADHMSSAEGRPEGRPSRLFVLLEPAERRRAGAETSASTRASGGELKFMRRRGSRNLLRFTLIVAGPRPVPSNPTAGGSSPVNRPLWGGGARPGGDDCASTN